MPSPRTSSSTTGPRNAFDAAPRFNATKLAAAIVRAALTMALIFALVQIAARPAQAQTEIVLHNFTGGADGGNPNAGLTFDSAGNLYGTTPGGGLGYGIVYELSPNGSGGWNETVLYSFTGGADGAYPNRCYVLFDSAGNIYGTASGGGANGLGVVFELSPTGSSWTETVLYSFAGGADGANPANGLVMDPAGNLYGSTPSGGTAGTIFELTPSGSGWTEQVIYSDGGSTDGVTIDGAGNIYGVGLYPGRVFEASPDGSGGWTSSVLFTFGPNRQGKYNHGGFPCGNLIYKDYGSYGGLIGTTEGGGSEDWGVIYFLDPSPSGWFVTVFNFKGDKTGDHPYSGVTPVWNSYYGTTQYGGKYGDGIVFSVWDAEETVLWNFNRADGLQPLGNVILDSALDVFGTTYQGGSSGAGVVFEITPPQAKTKAALSSSPNPSTFGQPVSFVATISPAPPNGETVSFMKGRRGIGTATLNAGSATLTTSSLFVGTNVIKAVYPGDTYLLGSSKTTKQVVNKAATTTTLTSSSNPSTQGQSVTFTATVAPQYGDTPQYGRGTLTGAVIFYDGTTELGRKSVRGGSAQLTTTKLTAGTHTITATYGGSIDFDSSTASLTQTVN